MTDEQLDDIEGDIENEIDPPYPLMGPASKALIRDRVGKLIAEVKRLRGCLLTSQTSDTRTQ